jgi:hypothetical protein
VLEAQKLIVEVWAVVAAVCLGFGLLERRVFGPRLESTDDIWTSFWTGWALLLSALQIWHLFLPVDDRARFAAVAVAAVGLLIGGAGLLRVCAQQWPRALLWLAAFAPLAWILSRLAMSGPRYGDVGLYLIPQVLWFESYPSVPGLANLYVPFGYNLTYFLYAAMLDYGPAAGKLYHTVNSALFAAVIARGVAALVRLATGGSRSIPTDMFYALALLPVAEWAYNGFYLTSMMPDTAVCLFGIVLAGETVALLGNREPTRAAMLRIVFLSIVALTVKLSLAGMAVAAGLLAWVWWAWRSSGGACPAVRGLVMAAVVGIVPLATWLARNVVTSGYPLYPASLFPFDVDWIARVDATAWIQRPMSMVPLHTIFTMWDWWQTRLVSLGWTEVDATRPAMLIAVGLALWLLVRPIDRLRGNRGVLPLAVLLVPLAASLFSFANTPMPRYQGAALWILGIQLVVLALAPIVVRHARVLGPVVAVAALAAACVPAMRGEPWPPHTDFEATPAPRIEERTLKSGLVIGFPENQVCWYAKLPCTPEPHPGLKLREPGNLAAGFRIDPEDADLPVPLPGQ